MRMVIPYRWWYLWVVAVSVSVGSGTVGVWARGDVGCTKVGTCLWSCRTEAKSGLIDLAKVGNAGEDPLPRWDAEPGTDGHSYSYNPCRPYNIRYQGQTNDCYQVIVCRQRLITQPYQFYNAGTQNTEKFVVLHGHDVVVQYTGDQGRQTNVHIVCGGEEPELTVTGEEAGGDPNIYWLKLSTKHGCLVPYGIQGSGLSTGSILCIIFATLLLVYVVGGALVLRYGRHAEGRDVIPNLHFWAALPSYVKDGCEYTARGVRTLWYRYRPGSARSTYNSSSSSSYVSL